MKKKIISLLIILFCFPVVNAKTNYLYDVIKEAAENDTGAKEYTGEHQDSIDPSRSTEKIYYYKSGSVSQFDIMEMNNVLFGGFCWKMLRTTDTGGVKLLYSGVSTDNKCIATNQSVPGYYGSEYKTVGSNSYYFTDDFEYDEVSRKYSLSGESIKSVWNEETSKNLIGKYTCFSSTSVDECVNGPYYIYQYINDTKALVLTLGFGSAASNIGKSMYNKDNNSLAYLGYMYGDVYENNSMSARAKTLVNTFSGFVNFYTTKSIHNKWVSNEVIWDEEQQGWKLVNPTQYVYSYSDANSLAGKYTLFSSSENTTTNTVYYIVGNKTDKAYYVSTTGHVDLNHTFKIGKSYVDNGDGTYSLINPEIVDYADYFKDANNQYLQVYTCGNMNDTCANLRYQALDYPLYFNVYSLTLNDSLLVAKSRNGNQLLDTLIVPKHKLLMEKENYSDYKYTCNTTEDSCSNEEMIFIDSFTQKEYFYHPVFYYGSSVTWDGEKYTLVNPIEPNNYQNVDFIRTHHYICEEPNQTSCETVRFIYKSSKSSYLNGDRYSFYYMVLKDGSGIEQAINNMFRKNKNDSMIKVALEEWFRHYLLEYTDYIDEVIYCNDRSFLNQAGFSESGNTEENVQFSGSVIANTNLYCANETDRFSVHNNKAKLKYSIGILSTPEYSLTGGFSHRMGTGLYEFWQNSPNTLVGTEASMNTAPFTSSSSTVHGSYFSYNPNNVYFKNTSTNAMLIPSISLKSEVEYLSGDGSTENPYIPGLVNRHKVDVVIKNETKDLDIEIEDITSVPEGEQVTFTVTPIKGFKITGIQIVDSSDVEIPYQETTANNQYTFIMPGEDVTIIPSYERTAAAVNVEENPHTKEIVIEVNDATAVVYEDVVRFTVEAEEGYELVNIEITDEEGNDVEYHKTNKENEYEFIMPATNVLIKPIYQRIEEPIPMVNPNTGRRFLWIGIILTLGLLTGTLYKKQKMKV